MAAKSFLHLNQLQFNLDVPPTANNMVFRHSKPEPINIERVGGKRTAQANPGHPFNTSGFSAISEDKLSAAVILARRDLKNRKLAEQMRANARSRSPSPNRGRSRTKINNTKTSTHSKHGVGQVKTQPRAKVAVKSKAPRTPPRLTSEPIFLPATTNSPPTRDTDRYPIHKVHIPFTESGDEIGRMQKELESYLNQIKSIEEKAITEENTDFLSQRRVRGKDGYLSDEEDIKRKAARSDEQTVRSARNLYNLRQQVRQIQKDFLQIGSNDVRQTKKSQALSKLTAAHRGAVRSMHAFVHQLPHQDLRQGLPSSYRELALLVRQLTILNTQIQRGQDQAANNQLITILDKVDELNEIWASDMRGHNSSQSQQQEKSPSRPPFVLNFNQKKQPFKLQPKLYGKENNTKNVLQHPLKKNAKINKTANHLRAGSPARKAALRAGVASLLKPTMAKKKSTVAFQLPSRGRMAADRRSVILPGRLQAKREKMNRVTQPVVPDSHFADPTIAANLKAVSSLSNPIIDEKPLSAPTSPSSRNRQEGYNQPPWIPPGSPNSSRSPSGERYGHCPSPDSARRCYIKDMDGDLIKRLFTNKEGNQLLFRSERQSRKSSRDTSFLNRSRSISPSPVSRLSPSGTRSPRRHSLSPVTRRPGRRRSLSPSLIDEIADAVRRKLKITKQENPYFRKHQSLNDKHRLDLDGGEKELTNMILEDVLTDTVHEFRHMESKDKIHRKAIAMQDSPTLENLIQRLQEMEEEQEDIRRRWESVSFGDIKPKSTYFTTSEILSDRPRSPVAIEVLCSRSEGYAQPRPKVAFSKELVPEPIIFTKTKQERKWTKVTREREAKDDDFDGEPLTFPSTSKPKTQLALPQTLVARIEDNREQFQHYLKKMSHHPLGRFDPWKLVEEITDQIMDECLMDVAHELDDLNEDMANHMYKSEFLVANNQSPSQASSKSTPLSPINNKIKDGVIPIRRTDNELKEGDNDVDDDITFSEESLEPKNVEDAHDVNDNNSRIQTEEIKAQTSNEKIEPKQEDSDINGEDKQSIDAVLDDDNNVGIGMYDDDDDDFEDYEDDEEITESNDEF